MKQVININFQGQVVPIEVSAFDLLKAYTESLNRYFANEQGKEEIINDIESRIGELFQERLKKGATCITDDDVNAIIASMGRPEDFDAAAEQTTASSEKTTTEKEHTQSSSQNATAGPKRLYRSENDKVIGGVCAGVASYFGIDPVIIRVLFVVIALAFGTGILAYLILWIAVPSNASTVIGGTRKKLFRDPDDKILGGVCSGVSNYFGINVWIPRVLFLIPFLSSISKWGHWGGLDLSDILRVSFSPGALIVYIILWLVLPEATTTAEKLEMKGEKVDLNSIKNSVMEEMKGVQNRAEKLGKEAGAFAEDKSKAMGAEMGTAAKRSSRSLGDIIILLIKIFAYFIIGTVAFVLVIVLFFLAIGAIGIFPLKDFLLRDGWQNVWAWGTLIFFVAVPVIGVITFIIRRLAKIKANRKLLRFSFISLWILGWVCVVGLITSVAGDFRSENDMVEQEYTLANPMVNSLEFTGADDIFNKNNRKRWLRFKPFAGITDEDSVYVNNVHFRILKSTDSSYRMTIIKQANGHNRQNAEAKAAQIEYNPLQKDSIVQMPAGISISPKNKFRNQHVIVSVYVPVGKKIKVNQQIWDSNPGRVSVGFDEEWDWDDYWGDEEKGWTTDVTYIMKEDGLYTLDGLTAKEYRKLKNKEENISIDEDGIEIKTKDKSIKIDENGVQVNEVDNIVDSLKQKLKTDKERLRDDNQRIKDSIKMIEQQLKKISYNAPATDHFSLQLHNPFGSI